MIRRITFILLTVVVLFLCEFILFYFFGRLFKPNLLIILIVYLTLAWGVRYSLVAAIAAGALKDSFILGAFGTNLFSYTVCACTVALMNRYVYRPDAAGAKVAVVAIAALLHLTMTYFLSLLSGALGLNNFGQAFRSVMVPEIIATSAVALFVWRRLRICVLRLFA